MDDGGVDQFGRFRLLLPVIRGAFGLALIASTALVAGCVATDAEPATSPSHPVAAYAELVAECLQERGWDAVATFDNSVTSGDPKTGIPADQLSAYQAAEQECVDELGYGEPRTPTTDQVHEMYRLDLEARDCMIELGFDIPVMPSEQVYVETFGTASGWDIGQQVPAFSSPTEYERVWTACPPPQWFPVW